MYNVGVDTGGTFTDSVAIAENGKITTAKALSTKPPVEGVINSLIALSEKLDVGLEQLLGQTQALIFGTTFATNAVTERKGVKVGLLQTRGFEDTHRIARGKSQWTGMALSEMKHMSILTRPEPIVPIHLVQGAHERVDKKGAVVCKLNLEIARESIRYLVEEQNIEALAISLLWAFKNPAHELAIKAAAREMYPDLYCVTSHEVAPVMGEYERTNTAIMDAYIGAPTKAFLVGLEKALKDRGLEYPMLAFQSDGGSKFATEASAVGTVDSGPVGGVVGARTLGEELSIKDIICTDVGGTTFDVAMVADYGFTYAREPVIEQFNIAYPAVDITSIGAGGGSIIWTDPVKNTLHVGPQSAGSVPGPACYGLGGVEPTITDALVVLGYVNPDYFLGGKMQLHKDKAIEAMSKVAGPLGVDVNIAAGWAYDIINGHMQDLMRSATIEKGRDIREFAMLAYGGASAAFAGAYAGGLGVKEVIVPVGASTFSAWGLAVADFVHTHVISDPSPAPMDIDRFKGNIAGLREKIEKDLDADGVAEADRNIRFWVEMRYGLQVHVVRLPVDLDKLDAGGMDYLAQAFDDEYERIFGEGSNYPSAGRFINNFVAQGVGRRLRTPLYKEKLNGADPAAAHKGMRDCWFTKGAGGEALTANLYDYEKLEPGNVVEGPAVIEAVETTMAILPGQTAKLDEYRNTWISTGIGD